jgi:hypothetical protein
VRWIQNQIKSFNTAAQKHVVGGVCCCSLCWLKKVLSNKTMNRLISRIFQCFLLLIFPIEALLVGDHMTKVKRSDLTRLNMKPMSRRDVLWQGAISSAAFVLSTPVSSMAASQARVETWPGFEYLEPIYELKLSVQALSQGADDSSKYPLLKQRLDKFFGGGLFSERNYYAGLGVQYTGQIEYDKNELIEFIRLDKDERFNSMEDTLNSLKDLLDNLKTESPDTAEVQRCGNQAKVSLNRWFALVPADDVDRVGQLFLSARKADANRNGKLEKDELETMSEEDRNIWKKRIDLVGG